MTPAEKGLPAWHQIIETRDAGALPAMIAEDATFHSPALFKPGVGRESVVGYLTAAVRVIGGPAFRYDRSWADEDSAVLEFRTEIDGREIHGVDMIQWNSDALISDFTVMVRPLSALNLVIEKMGAELARMLAG